MNAAIVSWQATVSSCSFIGTNWGTAIAVETHQSTSVVGCAFDFVDVYTAKLQEVEFAGNTFLDSSLYLYPVSGASIVGNVFVAGSANPDVEGIVIGGGTSSENIDIKGNVFSLTSIFLEWAPFNGVFGLSITDNTFEDGEGILMKGTPAQFDEFTVSEFVISNNVMDRSNNPGETLISIGAAGEDSTVTGGTISGNSLSWGGIRIYTDNASSGVGSISIKNNLLKGNVAAHYNIEIYGPDKLSAYGKSAAYQVTGNHLQTAGAIIVQDGDTAIVSGNFLTGYVEGYNASLRVGEIRLSGVETAKVHGNYVASGNASSSYADKASIYVEADSGRVSNNSVVARDTGGIDAAIIVDGPLTVEGNFFLGKGVGSTGTDLTDELLLKGSGATVGTNDMKTNVSAATNVRFSKMREVVFVEEGALTVVAGTVLLPFLEDAEIISVSAMVGTAPTGSSIVLDVNKNGSSIFTTKPTIAVSSNDSGLAYPDVTAVSAGDSLTIDVDQVGSTVPGSDLTVLVLWRKA